MNNTKPTLNFPHLLAHRRHLTECAEHLRAYQEAFPNVERWERGWSGINWAYQEVLGNRPGRDEYIEQAKAYLAAAGWTAEEAREALRASGRLYQEAYRELLDAGYAHEVIEWVTGHTAWPMRDYSQHREAIQELEDWIAAQDPSLVRAALPE